ncbi:MAG: peptidoglycan recognition protein family protein [Minisyncoccota bacterium]
MIVIPRSEIGLPMYASDYYPGPFAKMGVCLHNMGVGFPGPVTLDKAKSVTRGNYNYHLARWHSIDIMEGYDVYDVDGQVTFLEGRPWWSNCDAFSGMSKLGYSYIGWEVYGNYSTQYPSDTMLNGLAEGLAALYNMGMIRSVHMKGHLDFNYVSTLGPTDCPGRNLHVHIPAIVAEAARLAGVGPTTKGDEKVILPSPVQTTSVFPDIYPKFGGHWLHIKNESALEMNALVVVTLHDDQVFRKNFLRIPGWHDLNMDLNALVKELAPARDEKEGVSVSVITTQPAACGVTPLY